MRSFRAALQGAAFFLSAMLASPLPAQDVTLTARDGSISLDGNLLGFDGEFYRIDTDFGELTLDGTAVDCTGPACPDLANFVAEARIGGSPEIGTVLFPALIQTFADRNGYAALRRISSDLDFTYELTDIATGRLAGRFRFALSSSGEGIADLLADSADLVLSLREPTPAETALAVDAGIGNIAGGAQMQVLALDALVPVAATDSPLNAIELEALGGLLRGEADDWATLGLASGPVRIHMRRKEPALVIARGQSSGSPGFPVLHDRSADVADAVAIDPDALGVTRLSDTGNAKALVIAGSCGFDIAATSDTVKTRDYPLTAPVFILRPDRRQPRLIREFLAYLLTPAAQPVIRRAGFVDQAIDQIPLDMQGHRLAQAITAAGPEVTLADLQAMIAHLGQGRRLTPTFRFRDGSSELDPTSRSSILLMAQALESGMFDGKRLEFIGFSDSNGPKGANQRLAENRARQVLTALRLAAPTLDPRRVRLSVRAYGEALPIGCDSDDWGRDANRRVEVWVFQR